ncbi:MAG: glycerol-3-phosphate 1-O-acyltransferase PlsY [Rubricoccaceae bacterium]|nr:glycerol-3-phosphate 1-O-acyltransferase PlsY [Rubricoccaceae bacterium]
MFTLVTILIVSYLLGSIPVSLIAGRIRGIDLHAIGSGNAGATNVFRTLGVGAGILVFIMDAAKGFMATRLVTQLRLEQNLPGWLGDNAEIWIMVIAGSAAILGHVYTIIGRYFYGTFKGGKGVATGTGMLLGIIPVAIGVAMALFSAIVYTTRFVSLGSIIATVSLPLTLLVQRLVFHDYYPGPIFWFVAIVPVFILYTHRENVKRLLAGTEKRIGARSETPTTQEG